MLKPKRIGYPLSDAQILLILENLPQGEKHNRWRFAIQLCAVYGLRPEELRYLRIKDGANGTELWTIYQKSMGGTKGAKTEPRRCSPCWCVCRWICHQLEPAKPIAGGREIAATEQRRQRQRGIESLSQTA